jgi:hypothetical protein
MDGDVAILDTSGEKNLSLGMVASYKELETRAIEMLLSGENATIEQLRLQWGLSAIKHRKFTGVGFFTDFEVPQHIARTWLASFEIGDVAAWISGIRVGLLLFVRQGAISSFETYTYQEPWPETPVIERFLYRSQNGLPGETRDKSFLARLLKTADPSR